jgi:hypothetical protein
MADLTLTGVKIRFVTHNDNKDHDTILNVTVTNKVSIFLSEDIAEGLNLGGDMEFVDPSTHEFDLPLKSANIKLADITLPVTTIHIQPNGHDRWIFDYTVSLIFTDGTPSPGKTFSSTETGIVLDQDNKDHTGVFKG